MEHARIEYVFPHLIAGDGDGLADAFAEVGQEAFGQMLGAAEHGAVAVVVGGGVVGDVIELRIPDSDFGVGNVLSEVVDLPVGGVDRAQLPRVVRVKADDVGIVEPAPAEAVA